MKEKNKVKYEESLITPCWLFVTGVIFLGLVLFNPGPSNAELLSSVSVGIIESSTITIDGNPMVFGERVKLIDSQGRPIPYSALTVSDAVEVEFSYNSDSQIELKSLKAVDLIYYRTKSDYAESESVLKISTDLKVIP